MTMLEHEVLKKYKEVLMRSVPLNIPTLSEDELNRAIDYSIKKRLHNSDVQILNTYKHVGADSTILDLTDFILSKRPIMTAYGTLFTRHANSVNPLWNLIQEFVETRDKYKKKMFKYKKGSDEYNTYNLLQLVAKVDVNAIYGAMGNYSSIFYNILLGPSITTQGRSCISASIMMFESVLANNVKFGSIDEIVTFIDNIRTEKDRMFNNVLDENISVEDCFAKIVLSCGYRWVPNYDELTIIWEMLNRLSQDEVNRVFYKNNLYAFCDNTVVKNLIIKMLCELKQPFLNPNDPPEEILSDIKLFKDMIFEWVYYGYQIIDKLDRIETMIRENVIIVDTDSCIVCLDGWYHYVLDQVQNIPMRIKDVMIPIAKRLEKDEFGDREPLDVVHRLPTQYDYDFYNEKIIEKNNMISPVTRIPNDGLRHSIINIISYTISQLILDYMERFTQNYNSYDPKKKCLLIMKNEFLFKALMVKGRKNYASIQEVQEGNIVPKEAGLDIKGLPLDKVGTAKSTSKRLKEIIYNDILNADRVDQFKIMKEIAVLEKMIYNSLLAGETKYHKPARIKSYDTYEMPMRIQGIKASVAYNACKRPQEDEINLNSANSILVIKVNIDKKTVEKIKNTMPDIYEKMYKLLQTNEFKDKGITSIAIPYDAEIPDWITPFIDYTQIIQDNLASFPLDSIGITRMGNKNTTYSNILTL